MIGLVGLGLVIAAAGTGASAQQTSGAPACAVPTAPPPGLEGWTARTPLAAAADAARLDAATLVPGKAIDAALPRTPDVRYVTRPEKPGGSVSHGGLFAFDIAEAGTYRVALGAGAWIDVLDGGKAVVSTNHGPGPECSGIRKMVDFPLKPGRYVLQLGGNGSPDLPVMVAKLP
jgi:hypothetical protein